MEMKENGGDNSKEEKDGRKGRKLGRGSRAPT